MHLKYSLHIHSTFVPPRLHQSLPTSTHLSYHVHTLIYHHLCVTMFTSLAFQVYTYVTKSTSLSDHVHNFVLPLAHYIHTYVSYHVHTFGSPHPHMCHIMSTPLAHHIHTYVSYVHTFGSPHPHICVISCPHLWLTTSTHVSHHVHTFVSSHAHLFHCSLDVKCSSTTTPKTITIPESSIIFKMTLMVVSDRSKSHNLQN